MSRAMVDDAGERLMDMTQHLISAPFMALYDWPYWIGFTVLEGFSGYVQEAANSMSSPGMRSWVNALTRGGVLTMNLNYWDAGHGYAGGDVPLVKMRPAGDY